MPAAGDYVAKPGDKVAARVKAVDGDEQWILAEVVSYSHAANKYVEGVMGWEVCWVREQGCGGWWKGVGGRWFGHFGGEWGMAQGSLVWFGGTGGHCSRCCLWGCVVLWGHGTSPCFAVV